MPAGETEKSPSPWTIDSLHQHLIDAIAAVKDWAASLFLANERRIDAAIKTIDDKLVEMDRRYEDRWKAQQVAIADKDKTTDDRLAKMNEFRAQAEDLAKTVMPRSEAEQRIGDLSKSVDQRFTDQSKKLEAQDGRLTIEVRRIDERLNTTSGGVSGADRYRTTLFALIAAGATIVGLAFALFGR